MLKSNLVKASYLLLTLGILAVPVLSGAVVICPPGTLLSLDGTTCLPNVGELNRGLVPNAPDTDTALVAGIRTVLRWVQYALFIAATILIVLAAFDYLFSKGDAEKIKTAQNTLIYAIIALVIGVLAGGIPAIIRWILGVQ